MNNVKTTVIIGGVLVLMVATLIFLNRDKFAMGKKEDAPASDEAQA